MKSVTMQLRKRRKQRNIACDSNDTKEKRMRHKVSSDPLSFVEPQLGHQDEYVAYDTDTAYAQLLSEDIQKQTIGIELDIVNSVASHAQDIHQEVLNGTPNSKIPSAKDSVRKEQHRSTNTSSRTPSLIHRPIHRRDLNKHVWSQRLVELKTYKDIHGHCMVCLFAINTSLHTESKKKYLRSL
jgi:hypothetical protein